MENFAFDFKDVTFSWNLILEEVIDLILIWCKLICDTDDDKLLEFRKASEKKEARRCLF